jgi:hypothetical protein
MSEKIDLTPAVLDLVLYAGDGTSFQIDFVDDDDQPMDVSTISWAAQIRKTRTSDIASDLEINIDNASTGTIIVHISKDITRTIAKANQWDLQGTPVGYDDPITILQGSVTCKPDVTRPVEVSQ